MRFLLIALAAVLSIAAIVPAQAQDDFCPVSGARSFHPFGTMGRSFRSDSEAQDVVARIKRVLELNDDIKVCVTDAGEVANAEAFVHGAQRQRFIRFNRGFMEGLRAKAANYWSLIGIAAHEVGHHSGRHELLFHLTNCDFNHSIELDADYRSGLAMARMKAKLDDATTAMRALPNTTSCSHPPREKRLVYVTAGWTDGSTNPHRELVATSPTPSPAATRGATTTRGASSPRRAAAPATSYDARIKQVEKTTAPTGALAAYRTRHNRDVHGRDIERVIGVTLDGCAERCTANGQCKGFSFDRWNGWCFLKDAIPGSLLDPASIIGVRRGVEFPLVAKADFEMLNLRRRKFTDTPFRQLAETPFEACRTACNDELACVAFTATKADKSCKLFRQTDGHFFDEAFDSGFKRQLPPPAPTTVARTRGSSGAGPSTLRQEADMGFAGTGYDRHEDASYADCEVLCARDARCKALEHVTKQKVCRLFLSTGTKRAAPDTVIAIKTGS